MVAVDDEADRAADEADAPTISARERARRCRRQAGSVVVSTFTGSPAARARRRGGRAVEVAAAIRRHVVHRRALAQLQRADVGGDRPAIGHRHLRRIVLHRAEAVGHDVEEVADGRVAQALLVIRRRRRKPRCTIMPLPCARCGRGTASRTR